MEETQKKIEYDKPIEVSKHQYIILMRDFKGCVAGQIKQGKYFIKVWLMQYEWNIESILNYKPLDI